MNNDFNIYYGLAQGRPMQQQGLTAPMGASGLGAGLGLGGMGGAGGADLMELIRKLREQQSGNQQMQLAMQLMNMGGPSVGAPQTFGVGNLLSLLGTGSK